MPASPSLGLELVVFPLVYFFLSVASNAFLLPFTCPGLLLPVNFSFSSSRRLIFLLTPTHSFRVESSLPHLISLSRFPSSSFSSLPPLRFLPLYSFLSHVSRRLPFLRPPPQCTYLSPSLCLASHSCPSVCLSLGPRVCLPVSLPVYRHSLLLLLPPHEVIFSPDFRCPSSYLPNF